MNVPLNAREGANEGGPSTLAPPKSHTSPGDVNTRRRVGPVDAATLPRSDTRTLDAARIYIAHGLAVAASIFDERLENAGQSRGAAGLAGGGKVIQAEVEKSSGFKRLDEAARAGLSRCAFKPATVDGKPEQGWATMKYTWRLE